MAPWLSEWQIRTYVRLMLFALFAHVAVAEIAHAQAASVPILHQSNVRFSTSVVDSSIIIAQSKVYGPLSVFKFTDDGRVHRSLLDWSKALPATSIGNYVEVFALIDAHTVVVNLHDGSQFPRLCVISDEGLEDIDVNVRHAVVSGDGNTVVYIREGRRTDSIQLWGYHRASEKRYLIGTFIATSSSLQVSHDGTVGYVAGAQRRWTVFNVNTGEVLSSTTAEPTTELAPVARLHPSGSHCFGLDTIRKEGALRWVLQWYDVHSGDVIKQVETMAETEIVHQGGLVSVLPDGRSIVLSGAGRGFFVVDTESGDILYTIPADQQYQTLGYAPDYEHIIRRDPMGILHASPLPINTTQSIALGYDRVDANTTLRFLDGGSTVVFGRITIDSIQPQHLTIRSSGLGISTYLRTYDSAVISEQTFGDTTRLIILTLGTADTLVDTRLPLRGTVVASSMNAGRIVFYDNSQRVMQVFDRQTDSIVARASIPSTYPLNEVRYQTQLARDGSRLAVMTTTGGFVRAIPSNEIVPIPERFLTTQQRLGGFRMSADGRYFISLMQGDYFEVYDSQTEKLDTFSFADSTDIVSAVFTRDGNYIVAAGAHGLIHRWQVSDHKSVDQFFHGSSGFVTTAIDIEYDEQSNSYAVLLDESGRLEIIRRGVVNSTADEVVTPQTTSFAVSTSDDELTFALADVVDVRMSTLTGQDVLVNARLTADAVTLPLFAIPRGTYVVRAATSTGRIYTVLLQRN